MESPPMRKRTNFMAAPFRSGATFISMRSRVSFDGRGQRVVIGVEDEDSEQLCRLGLARVAADRMDRARLFGPALACPIDARLAVMHLRLNRARDYIGVNESR